LLKLNYDNIHGGILVYTPHKTKDEGSTPFQARVPLHPKALELIEKYRGVDTWKIQSELTPRAMFH
jgi:hypothetical protein